MNISIQLTKNSWAVSSVRTCLSACRGRRLTSCATLRAKSTATTLGLHPAAMEPGLDGSAPGPPASCVPGASGRLYQWFTWTTSSSSATIPRWSSTLATSGRSSPSRAPAASEVAGPGRQVPCLAALARRGAGPPSTHVYAARRRPAPSRHGRCNDTRAPQPEADGLSAVTPAAVSAACACVCRRLSAVAST